MDEGLKEVIERAGAEAKRPLMIEISLAMARLEQSAARAMLAKPEPDHRAAQELTKKARKAAREAASRLPPGELRSRLEAYDPMSEEEWERLCGPMPAMPVRKLEP